MENSKILILIIFTIFKLKAQTYQISFTGNGASNTVDSVKVENLSRCTNISLSGTDVLNLDLTNGINEISNNQNKSLHIYPNPMTGYCYIDFEAITGAEANLELYDIAGRRIAQEQEYLIKGQHSYRITGLGNGIYVLKIESNQYDYSAKIVSVNIISEIADNSTLITQINMMNVNTRSQQSNVIKSLKSDKSSKNMQFTKGDILKLTGFSGIYSTAYVLVPYQSQTVIFNFIKCTDNDNNNYTLVQIGTQTWMEENLKTTSYNDDSSIPNITYDSDWVNLKTPGFCWYNDSIKYKNIYGALYNWYAVNSGKLCPAGWHVADSSEWDTLFKYLGGNKIAGGKMKVVCSNQWELPNTGGTDSSGFTALPGGERLPLSGNFIGLGYTGCIWLSTKIDSNDAMLNTLHNNDAGAELTKSMMNYGSSVRCVKGCPSINAPDSGINISSENQIIWNWQTVLGAAGYKWNTTNNYNTSTDNGLSTSYTQTGLVCNTPYKFYVWAYNNCGNYSNVTTLIQTTTMNTAPVSVSITANPGGAICSGASVTFTATPTNGGMLPLYQWYNIFDNNLSEISGATNSTYTYVPLNNDSVVCVIKSNANCLIRDSAISNTIGLTVNPNLPVSISISAYPGGAICSGTSVTFTATPTNGGTSPLYQWYNIINNQLSFISGATTSTYTYVPLNNDSVICELISNASCVISDSEISDTLIMIVNPNLPVKLSIASNSSDTICSGTIVTFTATPTNGGTSPLFQWYKVAVNQLSMISGATTSTYTYSPLNKDSVVSLIKSNAICATPIETSDTIIMTVYPIPTASISGTTTVCLNSISPDITFTNPQAFPVTITYNINGSDQSSINVAANATATVSCSTSTIGIFTYNLLSIAYQSSPACINNISGTATVTVMTYIPITLTNNQASATVSGFQQQIYVNSSLYNNYESRGLENIEFSTEPLAKGNILRAWIENGASNTSTSTLYWVNLDTNSIAANSNLTIYMNFMSESVMTDINGNTGVAPQEYNKGNHSDCDTNCAQTSYGQYDNGAKVFLVYKNAGGPGPTGIVAAAPTSFPFIVEGLNQWVNGQTEQDLNYSVPATWPTAIFSLRGKNNPQTAFVYLSNCNNGCWVDGNSITSQNPQPTVETLEIISSKVIKGYTQYQTSNSSSYSSCNLIPGGNIISSGTSNSYWTRCRNYPPNGIMPDFSFGSICQ